MTRSRLVADAAAWLRARARCDRGFTIIEVCAAVLVLILVTGAGAMLFVNGSDTSVTAQRESQLISVVDQQIEAIRLKVKAQGFTLLAMSGSPVALASANTSYSATLQTDPNYFVSDNGTCGASGYGYAIEANYNNTAEGYPVVPGSSPAVPGVPAWSGCTNTSTQIAEPLEILGSGFVAPQQTVTVGTGTATVDTYVTDTYVGCNGGGYGGCPTITGNVVGCAQTPSSNWPTDTASTSCGDARRVIVAAMLNNNGNNATGPNAPVYVSTIFTNPSPSNEPTSTLGLTLGASLG